MERLRKLSDSLAKRAGFYDESFTTARHWDNGRPVRCTPTYGNSTVTLKNLNPALFSSVTVCHSPPKSDPSRKVNHIALDIFRIA